MPGETNRLPLKELTSCLTCTLCGGYFVDACTITECLHSFCKTCIVQFLETSSYCPVCDVLVHKTRPLVGVRPDRILQDLVYKLVPGLFANEVKRRKVFYLANPDLDPGGGLMTIPLEDPSPGADGNTSPSNKTNSVTYDDRFYTKEDQISVALEFSSDGRPVDDRPSTDDPVPCRLPAPRYLLCPAPFTIKLLKKFIRDKYGLPKQFLIEVFYAEESLNDSYTLMDIAYIYTWQRSVPLRLFYSIYNTGGPEAEALWQCVEAPTPPSTPLPSTTPSNPPTSSPPPSTPPSTLPPPTPHPSTPPSTPTSTPPRTPVLREDISSPQSPEATSSNCSTPTHRPHRKSCKAARWRSIRRVDQRRVNVVREALKFTIKPREGLIRRTSSSSSSTETVTETTTCTETRTRTIRRKRLKLSHILGRKFRRLEENDDNDSLSEKLAHLKLPVSISQNAKHSDKNLRLEEDRSCRWEISNYSFRCGEASSLPVSPSSGGSSPPEASPANNSPVRMFQRSSLSDGSSAQTGSNLLQLPAGSGSSASGALFRWNSSTPTTVSPGDSAPFSSVTYISPRDEIATSSSSMTLAIPQGRKAPSRRPSSWKRPLHFSPSKPVCQRSVSSIQGISMTNTTCRPRRFIDTTSSDDGLFDTAYTWNGKTPLALCSNALPISGTKAIALYGGLATGSSMIAGSSVIKFGTIPFNTTMKHPLS